MEIRNNRAIFYFIRYLEFLKPFKWKYLLSLILGMLSLALYFLGPYLLKLLIDQVLVAKDIQGLYFVIIVLLSSIITASVFDMINIYFSITIRERMSLNLTKTLFSKIEHAQIKSLKNRKVGNLLATITGDVDTAVKFVFIFIDDVLLNIFLFFYIFAMMLFIDPVLAIVTILVMPMLIFSQWHFGKILKKQSKSIRQIYGSFFDFLQEKMRQIRHIKIFCSEDKEYLRLDEKGEKLITKVISMAMTTGYSSVYSNFFTYFSLALVIGVGGYMVIENTASIGTLVAIYTYLFSLMNPVKKLSNSYASIKESLPSCNRINEILEIGSIKDSSTSVELKEIKSVDFKKVSFSYENEEVITDLSLTMKPGKIYGLFGKSGSGKSTIINLIYRFYDFSEGEIEINGKNIRNYKLSSLREKITIMDSRLVLMNTTIKKNISYPYENKRIEDIRKAAKLANIDEFIMKLPKNYNTRLGELSTELSEGQKQRIALARVILNDSPFIIFDEVTNFLDSENEKIILTTIKNMAKDGKLVLLISHKFSTIKISDKIFVLEKGRLCESGSYQDLIKQKDSKFFNLFKRVAE